MANINVLTVEEKTFFRDRFLQLRQEKNYTQAEMAKVLGCSRTSVQAYESGKTTPTLLTISAIALALDTTPGYLLGHKSSPASDIFIIHRGRLNQHDFSALRLYEKMSIQDRGAINYLISRLSEMNS